MSTDLAECVVAPEIISRENAKARRLKRYFTGEACARLHIEERLVSNGRCLGCDRSAHAVRRTNNPGRVREVWLKWYSLNREQIAVKTRAWHKNNPEYRREYEKTRKDGRRAYNREYYKKYYSDRREAKCEAQRQRRIDNPSAEKSRDRLRYKKNAELNRERARQYRSTNPEKVSITSKNKRAKRRQAEGKFTATDLTRIRKAQRNRCATCRVRLAMVKEHTDHIQPLSRGGTNWPSNIQILCSACNTSKNARDPIEFCQSLGMLL